MSMFHSACLKLEAEPIDNHESRTANCPACEREGSLRLVNDGQRRCLVRCQHGCKARAIALALGFDPKFFGTLPPEWRPLEVKTDDEANGDGDGHRGDDGMMALDRSAPSAFWEPPRPFNTASLPAFPINAMPPVLSNWILAEAVVTQTPPDVAGLLALAACSGAIARNVVVQPREGWREPTNIFVAVLLEPGSRKSAVFQDALAPIQQLEMELLEKARPVLASLRAERRVTQLRLEAAERQASKGDPEARQLANELATWLATTPEPFEPRLVVDDATSERLGALLHEQQGRIISASAEGGGVFDLMAGRYSRNSGGDFGVYLKGHAGDTLRVDRLSRPPVHVERPAITCALALQPQVLAKARCNDEFRGRGLLARFLFAAPPSLLGQRMIAPPAMIADVRRDYHETVRRLVVDHGDDHYDHARVLKLLTAARTAFNAWEQEVETMLGEQGALERIRDWGGKLAGLTLRLAAVLHCVEPPAGEWEINPSAMAGAIALARYAIEHARHILEGSAADSVQDDARFLLRWLAQERRREFTLHEACRHGQRRWRRAEDAEPAAAELESRGYLMRDWSKRPSAPGRPSSPRYFVHPSIAVDPNALQSARAM